MSTNGQPPALVVWASPGADFCIVIGWRYDESTDGAGKPGATAARAEQTSVQYIVQIREEVGGCILEVAVVASSGLSNPKASVGECASTQSARNSAQRRAVNTPLPDIRSSIFKTLLFIDSFLKGCSLGRVVDSPDRWASRLHRGIPIGRLARS